MKEIIVAIDFSTCSMHALNYAVMLSNVTKADIKMIWVDNNSSPDALFTTTEKEIRQEKKKYFEEIIKKHEGQLTTAQMSYKLRKGKVFNEIATQAKADNAFLIVSGTHGVSGFEEYWIGSNTYRIVTNAPCPVITIRKDFEYGKNIEKIIFPIDSTPDSMQKLEYVTVLANLFKSQINILAIYPKSINVLKRKVESNTKKAVQYLEKKEVTFSVESIVSDDITRTIINYAQKQNADLVATMTEQSVTKSNVFLGSNAQQLVNNSPIPLLNIRSK
ncbi:MAG: universal stress protein [Bacteroidetes bacterium]|nr:universal stress protein [Bacteroidota bacterium]